MSRFRFYTISAAVFVCLVYVAACVIVYLANGRSESKVRESYYSVNLQIHRSHEYFTTPNQYLSKLPVWIADSWENFTGNRFPFSDIKDSRSANCPLNSEEIFELKKLKDTHVNRADLKVAQKDGVLFYLKDCSGVSYVDIGSFGSTPELSAELLAKLPLVVGLWIQDDRLRDQDIETLVGNPDLMMLSINGANLGKRGLAAIAKSKSLLSVSIRSGSFSGDQFRELLSHSVMAELSLWNCKVSDAADCANGPATSLQAVSLSQVSVAVDVLRILRTVSSIASITLSDGDFDARFAKPIEDLRQTQRLQILNSRIGDEFLSELESAKGLKIVFIGCEISPSALVRLRKNCTVLENKSSMEVEF